jgi:hypothetical protein
MQEAILTGAAQGSNATKKDLGGSGCGQFYGTILAVAWKV